MTRAPDFETFRRMATLHRLPLSVWIREPGLRIYMRAHCPYGANYVLANIEATGKFGQGVFTRWLDQYEKEFRFSVENILNPRLIGFLARRGYVVPPGFNREGPPDMIGPVK